ncbi:MAG: hypothetical protein GY797_11545 [Deltaproteobacteria bacterium]|nr:hypothetical protein [Deltaproteobacteria bacterium]
MKNSVTLTEVKMLTRRLPLRDKLRLIEWIAPQIERDIQAKQSAPRKSLRGLWRGLNLTETDIDEARREMWVNFPREDI